MGSPAFFCLRYLYLLINIMSMLTPMTGKPQLNRRVNRALILDRIRVDGEISRADLAKITEIRPPTITAVVRDLIGEGLVVETGNGKTRGGRAPRMIALSSERAQTLGFEITETEILAGLCDLSGNLLSKTRVDYSPDTPEATVSRLFEVGEELFALFGKSADGQSLGWSDLQCVGVAVPGLIDERRNLIRWSQPFGWREIPFGALCQERWSTPTDVVNDSVAGGLAAHFLGSHKCRNLVYVVLRFNDASNGVVGIGTAIIMHGEPYHGEFGAAGEITTPIPHPLEDAKDAAGNRFADVSSYVAALTGGQPGALAAMDGVAEKLSLLLVHAINLLEPGCLILEVDSPEIGAALWERLQQNLREHTLRHEPGKTELMLSTLGDFGGVRGAIVPALRRVFKLPQWN